MKRLMLAALLCAGCNTFDPISYLTGLRVIAIVGQPPDVAAGQSSTLTPVIPPFELDGGMPSLSYDWAICEKPPLAGAGDVVNPDCLENQAAPYLVPAGNGPTATVTMPKVSSPTALGLPDGTGGFYLPVRLRLTAGSATLTAVYRLRLNLGQPPNHNPKIDGMFIGDPPASLDPASPPEVHAGDQVTLSATVTPDSVETYLAPTGDPQDPIEPRPEAIAFQWYSTFGDLSQDTTGDAQPDTVLTFDKHPPPSGATIDLWVVALDGRGGADVAHRTLSFR